MKRLTREQRKEVFQSLVTLQDLGASVEDSRELARKNFRITIDQLRLIEEEGLVRDWELPALVLGP